MLLNYTVDKKELFTIVEGIKEFMGMTTQLNYTVSKKELLWIVEGINVFERMIRGFDLTIHMDNLNLL